LYRHHSVAEKSNEDRTMSRKDVINDILEKMFYLNAHRDRELVEWVKEPSHTIDSLHWILDNIGALTDKSTNDRYDVFGRASRVGLDIVYTSQDKSLKVHEEWKDRHRCNRCYKLSACVCAGGPQRLSRYSPGDWRARFVADRNDRPVYDTVIDFLNLQEQQERAYDLQPYGMYGADTEFTSGDMVTLCVPYHALQHKTGLVVDRRTADGKFKVKFQTKYDSTTVYHTMMCEAKELRRRR
jgi:hypothetical protein